MSGLNKNLRKLVYGVGVNDSDYVTQPLKGERCPYFDRWHSMLRRCYSEKSLEKFPIYTEVEVQDEWLIFSNFKSWMEKQDWKGCTLDKDLIGNGKLYSKETCVFIQSNLNSFIMENNIGEYPLGVSLKFLDGRVNCFVSQSMIDGKKKHLGVFSNATEAHRAWQLAKLTEVAKLIDIGHSDGRVVNSLHAIHDMLANHIDHGKETKSLINKHYNNVRLNAIDAHGPQKYGEYPYSFHLDSVAIKCRELYGYDYCTMSAAYNHDRIEDTDCEHETVGHACGWKVADAVVSITKIKGESYKDYIKRVRGNELGLKVKIADTLCNLEESIKINDVKRIKKYSKQIQLLCE